MSNRKNLEEYLCNENAEMFKICEQFYYLGRVVPRDGEGPLVYNTLLLELSNKTATAFLKGIALSKEQIKVTCSRADIDPQHIDMFGKSLVKVVSELIAYTRQMARSASSNHKKIIGDSIDKAIGAYCLGLGGDIKDFSEGNAMDLLLSGHKKDAS